MTDNTAKLASEGASRSLNHGLVRRAFDKLLLGPIKYRSKNGYDASRYWDDRLRSYGLSLQGVGHEGMTEHANAEMYAQAADVFGRVMSSLVGERPPKTLEVGTGTGFYTEQLRRLGVTDYTGLDITPALFDSLRSRFPAFDFRQADITTDAVNGEFDLVVMIDVTEHIVTAEGLRSALEHLKDATAPGGFVVIGPQFEESARHLYYVHFWSVSEVRAEFAGWDPVFAEEFRGGTLLAFQKQA